VTMSSALKRSKELVLAALALSGTLGACHRNNEGALLAPKTAELAKQAPDSFRVEFTTSKGKFVVKAYRAWAPNGVDRFYNLVRHGYYDEARFFRIRARTWAQFGVAADPRIAAAWRTRTIPDDPRVLSNTRGTVAYAFKDRNGRTTQAFINLADNSATHDAPADGNPFVPFARAIEGMSAADALYADYGEPAGGGIRGGKQDVLFKEGNAFLLREFPKLDYIKTATIGK